MKIMSSLRAFGRDQSGASLAEYAILLAIMGALAVGVLPGLKDAIVAKFTGATTALTSN